MLFHHQKIKEHEKLNYESANFGTPLLKIIKLSIYDIIFRLFKNCVLLCVFLVTTLM